MGNKEKEIINEVLIEGSKTGRLFRANSGMGWQGETIEKNRNRIILGNPRPFHGMPEGTADVIGWESKELCEILREETFKHPCEHYKNKKYDKTQCVLCGYHKKIAVFKAVEVKTGKQKLTDAQRRWRDKLIEDGGIYEEKRDV